MAEEPVTVSLAENLITGNTRIKTMRCEIRREQAVDNGTLQMLSRVWYKRPDRLCVETVLPETRRIVADGTAVYKWIEGETNGVRLLIDGAPEAELIQVRKVPGTAEEYLMRLRGVPELVLPETDGFPVRRAYTPEAPHPYTILSLDATGRLARLEFFDPENRTNRLLVAEFSGWKEVLPGIWIPCLQKTAVRGRDDGTVNETLRISGLVVNEPITPEQFDVNRQIPGVHFLTPPEMEEKLRRRGNN